MAGKKFKGPIYLFSAFRRVSGKVVSPSQSSIEPWRKRVRKQGGAKQINGLVETVAAQGEHGAEPRDRSVMGQMRACRKVPKRAGQIAIDMEFDPAHSGEDGFRALRRRSDRLG